MAETEKWEWQEPGTTWKGAGLYHITLTVTDRQPVLGTRRVSRADCIALNQMAEDICATT